MKSPVKGLRLGAKLLMLMSVALVVIPWYSYLYLSEMEDFLVDSQANAQLLTAEGISTLLNGRSDLFYELPLSPEGYEQLYAHPLQKPIRIDGKNNDWEEVLEYNIGFGNLGAGDSEANDQRLFHLALGEHNDQIYALVTVRDDALVFRDRNILRLDLSDHLRITFTGQDDEIRKIVVTMTEPGVTTAYAIDNDWRYAIRGEPENRIQGFMTETADGYIIEFRIPLELLGSRQHFGLAVVDIDDPDSREIESVTGTLPSAGKGAFDLVLLKSPEVLRIIEGLGYSGANIQVIDAKKRVRAEVGSYETRQRQTEDTQETWTDAWLALVGFLVEPLYNVIEPQATSMNSDDEVLDSALTGNPSYQRRYSDEGGEVIVAAHPIIALDTIIGAVLLQQNTNRILELRRDALQRIVNFSLLSLLIFVVFILVFSGRLAGRIRRLGSEATNAIDTYGRLRANQIRAETRSGDEIGDLARSISDMLSRLHQHNRFLENMPRTLRHEINNPLNTLSTSLQNLESEEAPQRREKYLEAAKRGVMRIGVIVQNLADAASLEDALQAEELEVVDLYQLLQNYLGNAKSIHRNRHFRYQGTSEPALTEVSDYRIEQLLDKLVDNAVDFSPDDSTITVGLDRGQENLTLFVTNTGPTIGADIAENIFDSMVSVRKPKEDNRLHFGMGLYVVRIIAEHHGGKVSASNLRSGSGVTITVTLPLYTEKTPANEAAEAFAAS